MTPENQKKHDIKLKRMTDALTLKVPDRVPIEIAGGSFMVKNAMILIPMWCPVLD